MGSTVELMPLHQSYVSGLDEALWICKLKLVSKAERLKTTQHYFANAPNSIFQITNCYKNENVFILSHKVNFMYAYLCIHTQYVHLEDSVSIQSLLIGVPTVLESQFDYSCSQKALGTTYFGLPSSGITK